ncbi:hypothetical protein [Nocardioides terrisoli]|uniref:hypothetical protein n=1 Tax=Nocardioides terrisoli TaxID=3388267 RepID=UPI00287BAECF|nr:hypothetical protein [Nocardioides marmorisolisilvae]
MLVLSLLFVAVVFPPVNWPDERRNLGLLQAGGYGVFYGRFLDALRWLAGGLTDVGPFDASTSHAFVSENWQRIDGALRYATVPGDASTSYYVAKLGNVILVVCAVAIFWYARRRWARSPSSAREETAVYVLALLMPSVCYQLDQISTDIGFILMSAALYFVRSRRGRLIYALAAAACVFEDRSYVILAVIALGYALLPLLMKWRLIRDRPAVRYGALCGAAVAGTLIGTALAHQIQFGAGIVPQYLGEAPGFTDLSTQISYTWGKSFSAIQNPVVLYAGLVYLPSAAEFFVRTVPLYLLALPVFVRLIRIAGRDKSETGQRFFYLLLSVIATFFAITNATHVFQHGRYYFAIAPLLVIALSSIMQNVRSGYGADRRALTKVAIIFVSLNVLLTSLIALPTLFNSM